MNPESIRAALAAIADPAAIRQNERLAPHTSFDVGGLADWVVTVTSVEQLRSVVRLATQHDLPLTILGGGTNVVVSDDGVRGLVVLPRLTAISSFDGFVRAEAGVTINGLVRWTISRGLKCVEDWAGTPGTVGGAVYGNAHFRGRDIADRIELVQVMMRTGEILELADEEMEFAYDSSRLQRTGEVLIWAQFLAAPGSSAELRSSARESLAHRKATQPLALASAGCLFQNPDRRRDPVPQDIPPSAGALIDRAGMKGFRVGGATISDVHANFVVNDGSATAADIRAVAEAARDAVKKKFGVTLRDEVVYLGRF